MASNRSYYIVLLIIAVAVILANLCSGSGVGHMPSTEDEGRDFEEFTDKTGKAKVVVEDKGGKEGSESWTEWAKEKIGLKSDEHDGDSITKKASDAAYDTASGAGQYSTEKAKGMKDMAAEKVGETLEYAKDKVYDITNAAKDKTYEAASAAKEKAYDTGNAAKEKAYDTGNAAKEKAYDTARTVKDGTYETTDAAQDKVSAAAKAAKDKTYETTNAAKDKASKAAAEKAGEVKENVEGKAYETKEQSEKVKKTLSGRDEEL